MRFFGKTRILQLAVAAAAVVAFSAHDAMARSRGSYGSYGSYGSSGSYSSYGSYGSSGSYASYSVSYGSSGSYGSYGSYGSSGSSGRAGLFARWHARKAAKHSYGSYGGYGSNGSSGSYAVSYGSSGGYGSYGSSGSSGGSAYYGDTVYEGDYTAPIGPSDVPPPAPADGAAPVTPQPAVGPEGAPAVPPQASATEAEIYVSLPADAKVFVNDLATTSTGAERHYVSRGLQYGQTYTYKLRVEFQRDGQPVTEDKLVRLQAGRAVKLAFGGDAVQQAATEVKLHVPANAKVTLAGAATQQTGEVRTYESTTLKPGQKWNGYTVRVELEQDGKTLVEERSIDIEGGKTYELSFDMTGDATKLASAQ